MGGELFSKEERSFLDAGNGDFPAFSKVIVFLYVLLVVGLFVLRCVECLGLFCVGREMRVFN
jgi:hypothetical protein